MSTALGLGLGVGLTLDVVADTCRARLAGDPALAQIGYVNLGLRHDDLIPDGVPALLNECGWPVVVHAIDVNLSTALDEDEVLSLARLGDALDARWFEEDLGVWVWGRMSLGLHHLPPLLTQHSVEVSAANIARCRYLLGRPLHIENPPVHYAEGDLDMWEFLAAVADAAECGIVLDSGHLIGYHLNTDTPIELRADWPGWPAVRELHISGFQLVDLGESPTWIDQHPAPLPAGQLTWVEQALRHTQPGVAVCLEQDGASDAVVAASVDRVARLVDAAEVSQRRGARAHSWSTVPEPPRTDADATDLIQRYGQILHAFYDVDAEPPVAPQQRARFLAERSRRVLDVARVLHSGWPRTGALARAYAEDGLVQEVAREVPRVADRAGSVTEAVEAALVAWIDRFDVPVLPWVFAFEQLSLGHKAGTRPARPHELARLGPNAGTEARVVEAPFDLPRMVRALDFLLARSAPAAHLREVVPCGGPVAMAAYRDGSGRVSVRTL